MLVPNFSMVDQSTNAPNILYYFCYLRNETQVAQIQLPKTKGNYNIEVCSFLSGFLLLYASRP